MMSLGCCAGVMGMRADDVMELLRQGRLEVEAA